MSSGIFGAKIEAETLKMFHIFPFPFLLSSIVFETVIPFPGYLTPSPVRKVA